MIFGLKFLIVLAESLNFILISHICIKFRYMVFIVLLIER